jgi:hypothetical protein
MAFKVFNNRDEVWDQQKTSSWWLPWGYLLWFQDRPDNNTCPQGPASNATRQDTGQETAHHLARCQDTVHNATRMDTGGSTTPLHFYKVKSVSHSHCHQTEGLSDLLGLADLSPLQDHLEEPRVTVKVARRPQSPPWCYLTPRVSFILHRSPWWG